MSEYYQGKDIITRFDVFEDGEETIPESGYVVIYDPDNLYVNRESVEILGSEVRHKFSGDQVNKTGRYTFVFNIKVRGLGDYTHVVKADVKSLPMEP